MGSKQLSLGRQPTVVAQQLLLVVHELRDLDYMGERGGIVHVCHVLQGYNV